jgi:hypothetical protein
MAALDSYLCSTAISLIAKKIPLNATQAMEFLWFRSVLADIPVPFVLRVDMPPADWHIEWVYPEMLMLFSIISYFIKLFYVVISFFKLAYI